MIPVNRPFIVPEHLICRECGGDMQAEITRPNKGRLIVVTYKCAPCGYQHVVKNPNISNGDNLAIPKPTQSAASAESGPPKEPVDAQG